MELKICALAVTLISSVIANPYGYGVKGGAGASAQALAGSSAGAFGGNVPVIVPFGNGFSGSFTKSSSSSSSSSSASSSSSSSSFSYSGSGAGGYSNLGLNGNIGCTSGICQNSGANALSTNFGVTGVGAGAQEYNSANAVAAASSESGTNCQGPKCISNSEKCSSGQCPPKPPGNNEKCTSGLCDTKSQTNPSVTQYDNLDDIQFVAHTTKSTHDSKDQSSSDHRETGYSAHPNCPGNSCGTTTNPNSQTSLAQQSTTLLGNQPLATAPSIDLETPKQDSNCDSPNCNTEYSRPSYDNSLTSYNVPIHGAYDNNKQKPQCDDGKCDSSGKGTYSANSNSLSTNYLNSQDTQSTKSSYYPSAPSSNNDKPSTIASTENQYEVPSSNSGSKCNLPSCNPIHTVSGPTGPNSQPGQVNYALPVGEAPKSNQNLPVYTDGFGAPAGILTANPSHTHPSSTVQKLPMYGSASTVCNAPNCFGQTSSPGSHVQPIFSGNKPSADANLPIYTGGFGGPAGMLKPNEYYMPPAGINKPLQSAIPTHNTPSHLIAGCTTANCFGSPNIAGATSSGSTQSGSYATHKENGGDTVYTEGFGGPAGILKPNEFSIIAPKLIHSTNPTYNSQSAVISTPSCKTQNCNVNSLTAGAVAGANAQSGSSIATTPSIVLDSSSELPIYAQTFGRPIGLLKPDFAIKHNSDSLDTALNNKPTNIHLAGCSTPNCSPHTFEPNIVTNTHSPITITTPITPIELGYTSHYGRPVGVTYPSPIAVAPITLSSALPILPTGYYSSGCTTANCSNHPTSEKSANNAPTGSTEVTNIQDGSDNANYNSGLNEHTVSIKPSGQSPNLPSTESSSTICKSSDCTNLGSTIAGSNAQAGSYAGSKQNLPAYTSGFGAPTGLLKPHDDSISSGSPKPYDHTKPSGTAASPGCISGYCNTNPTLPSSPSYNGATSSSGSQVTASSSASANAVAYSGGFGGPPGILKPYDDDKTYIGLNYEKSNVKFPSKIFSTGSSLNTGTTSHHGARNDFGALANSGSTSNAFSSSSTSSTAGSNGDNNHGPHLAGNGVKTTGPCGGGCGTGYQDGVTGSGSSASASAKSLSSSGGFGLGGSFASSSSSAHSSAGSYTKGGYGKR